MLATADDGIPAGDDWVFEVKFDGYRTLAYIRHGECRLVSRNEIDLTERFAEIAKEVVKATKSPNAVLDGEICRLDPSGRSSFSELQQGDGPLVLYAFDLLELDGVPLVDLPLTERKQQVAGAARRRATGRCGFSDDFDDGEALLAAARPSGGSKASSRSGRRRATRRASGRATG